jgi:acetoin utilization protein AcuB
MSKNVITVDAEESMHQAMRKMENHKIKMFPVMKKDELVGIITDGDLKKASASDANLLDIHEMKYLLTKIKVKKIMTKDVVTVPDDHTVEEAAEVLLKNNISGLPVVNSQGRLAGIITQADLFRVIISLTGIGKRGIQFSLLIEDRPGSIKEIADIIRSFGGRLLSILTSYDEVEAGKRKLYIRLHSVDRDKLGQLNSAIGEKSEIMYMVDHRNNIREILDQKNSG